ncbi:GNAT family N-acetyltransferase [Arthrobacter sp. Y-9]|uniref:GNAT family N-acetyltransferase n=1 Tax=Arthrobacter sp. Y-9 TaxID=3039385 RepID=UPI00241E5291|nr:GNAT family N-acetyltransferase [Arthrobacter sp. Y-9]WFR85072.1 GNAT family N-acetyltransferase [Arthrobacter sp. Y-9]
MIRELVDEDLPALRDLALRDEAVNAFVLAQTVRPWRSLGATVFGVFDDGGLIAACWAGANVVPIALDPSLAPLFAYALHSRSHRYASIFGPSDAVLALLPAMEAFGHVPLEVRRSQPFLLHDGELEVESDPSVRAASMDEFDRILPASVAMFEEEVGYSPFLGGQENYRRRVLNLLRQGHTLARFSPAGQVLFKADLGVVTRGVCQIQGVWMDPAQRGRGMAAARVAAVVEYSRRVAGVASLYVNDYNTAARKVYEKVGFREHGEFATVLY